MKLSRQEVEKIARLARLSLSDEEIEQYRSQLSEVLTYVDQLNELDINDVPTTAQVTGQTNVLADDVVQDGGDRQKLLKNAPATDGDSIKVKAVFE
jgi:aspartyl-tRNA(Asn)/glutamyl-tRNA(Gln) amidotransferase subunit C